MSNTEIPTLVKRCLTHGVVISPYQLDLVLDRYAKFMMPDDVLNKLGKQVLAAYVKGLYLCSLEMASDWNHGYTILKGLGFTEESVRQGHRSFVTLVYKTN
jgi:hypothetical protein